MKNGSPAAPRGITLGQAALRQAVGALSDTHTFWACQRAPKWVTPEAPCPAPSAWCPPSAQLHSGRSAWLALSPHSASSQKSPCRSEPAECHLPAHTSFTPAR